jgi:hypothetical protein
MQKKLKNFSKNIHEVGNIFKIKILEKMVYIFVKTNFNN